MEHDPHDFSYIRQLCSNTPATAATTQTNGESSQSRVQLHV